MLYELRQVRVKNILQVRDASIPEAKVTCIFGESGAGKTTFLRLLNRLENADEGTILFRGRDILQYDPVELRRRVVMLGQTPVLFPGDLGDNLNVGRRWAGLEPGSDTALEEILAAVKLKKPLQAAPETLSGGEKQRLALARVLLMEPDVLLLDEPSASLDEETEHMIIEKVVAFARQERRTLIMVTHARWVVDQCADELIELANGRRKER